MQTQYSVLGYRTELSLHDYKLTIDINDRNIDYEIKKVIVQRLGCEFIRINPDKEDFHIFKGISEILRHIKQ